MGLSGRKVKQRIPNDPRNLAWADDAAKFGSNYLAKFGWDSSKGLGVDGDGMKSHIKVAHKLDMLGIGAAHRRDPDGIAWKQSQDFEKLLARLNASSEEGTSSAGEHTETTKVAEAEVNQETATTEDKKEKKRKKREEDGSSEKKKKKKRKTEEVEEKVVEAVKITEEKITVQTVVTPPPSLPRHRAHRARAIASKNISSKSASAIAEILGIASSSSNTPSIAPTPTEDTPAIEQLTISTKSVADYFKEKLRAKSDGAITPSTPETPAEDYDVPVRTGLGAGSRLRMESTFSVGEASSSYFSKAAFPSFAASSTLVAPTLDEDEESSSPESASIRLEQEPQEEATREKKKKDKKKEKRTKTEPEKSEKKEKRRKKSQDAVPSEEEVDKAEEKRRKKQEKEERKQKKKSKEEKERT